MQRNESWRSFQKETIQKYLVIFLNSKFYMSFKLFIFHIIYVFSWIVIDK